MAIEFGTVSFASLLIAVSLILYIKLFPDWSKTTKKKIAAFFYSKVMWRVHYRCQQQKIALFRAMEDLVKRKETTAHILEIGVGPGNNFAFYPKVCTVSCLDPNLENRPYALQALQRYPGIKIDRFLKGFAENMSEIDDNSFDAVICTFTLCSVRQPQKAVNEIKRVLKPAGSFFFLEHVAAVRSTKTYLVQTWLDGIWHGMMDGCHLTNETWTFITAAGFSKVQFNHFAMDGMWFAFFLKPCLYGVAVK